MYALKVQQTLADTQQPLSVEIHDHKKGTAGLLTLPTV